MSLDDEDWKAKFSHCKWVFIKQDSSDVTRIKCFTAAFYDYNIFTY